MEEKGFYAYILECSDGTLYTGWTTHPAQRLEQHNAGKASRYTRARLPVKLLNTWCFSSKQEAMRFEWQVKQLSRAQKLRLLKEKEQAEVNPL